MLTVTVCVGSSCHIKGARDLIMRLDGVIKERDLAGKIELKGSFCMERCGEGVNWQIGEEPISSESTEAAVAVFRRKVLEPLGIRTDDRSEGGAGG